MTLSARFHSIGPEKLFYWIECEGSISRLTRWRLTLSGSESKVLCTAIHLTFLSSLQDRSPTRKSPSTSASHDFTERTPSPQPRPMPDSKNRQARILYTTVSCQRYDSNSPPSQQAQGEQANRQNDGLLPRVKIRRVQVQEYRGG